MGKADPSKIVVGSFVLVILAGTMLLALPWATVDGRGLSLVNALFTATSATCVTGLTVVDTGRTFTPFGQITILLLIQIGGLGVMTLSTFFLSMVGRRISLRGKIVVQDALNYYDMESLLELIRYILIFTFLLEMAGALLLAYPFCERMGAMGIYAAVFHAVSAFCNAGFSLFSDSLVSFKGNLLVNGTMMGLIVMGGLGFPVLLDLYKRFFVFRGEPYRLRFQTKLVLTVTAFLIVTGAAAFLLFEMKNTLAPLPWGTKVLASLFQAVTPRTAGFNTLNTGAFREATLFFIIFLMFVGASPGGTGGGIKTTTAAIVLFSIRSILREEREVNILGRTIPPRIVSKAFAIFFLSAALIFMTVLTLLLFEPNMPLIKLSFEVVSAFGTVGLSTGITPTLSGISKVILSVVMLAGRVGPLTLVLAMARREVPPEIRYPEAQVMVG